MLTMAKLEEVGFFDLKKIKAIRALCDRLNIADLYVMPSTLGDDNEIEILIKSWIDYAKLPRLGEELSKIFDNKLVFICSRESDIQEAIQRDSVMSATFRDSTELAIELGELSKGFREAESTETLYDLLYSLKHGNGSIAVPPLKFSSSTSPVSEHSEVDVIDEILSAPQLQAFIENATEQEMRALIEAINSKHNTLKKRPRCESEDLGAPRSPRNPALTA